jgi:hypothetical protein
MSIVRFSTTRIFDGVDWQDAAPHVRLRRGTSTASPATNPPYPIVWVMRWEPVNTHPLWSKRVRTIESFLLAGETLHGDGVTDDTVVFNRCLGRVRQWAGGNYFPNFDDVVTLTRTYLCDQPLEVAGITPRTSLEITGPGGTTRTPYRGGLPQTEQPYFGSDRFQPNWIFRNCKRLKLTSFKINSWRRPQNSGGRNNDYEAQHGIWGDEECEDLEFRNLTITNVMGDGFQSFSNGLRVYGCRIINTGRLVAAPWATDVDFYGNYCERNSASMFDIETLGSTQMSNQVFRNNEFWNCHGVFLHIPNFLWTERFCTATNGSPILTSDTDSPSSRFNLVADKNREIRNSVQPQDKDPGGDGIPPGTTIISVQSIGQATMSQPASGVTVAEGYRRIYQYLGSRILGLEVRENVRHCTSGHASPGEVSMDAGGGVRLDGTYTLEDVVWEDNIWDRPNRGGAFWRLNRAQRVAIRNNRGPWRNLFSGAQVVQLDQVTEPDGSPYTSSECRADNPNVFQSPV